MILLASSTIGLQLTLELFAAEFQEMRISTSMSKTMALNRKRVECPLRVGDELLPSWRRVLFTSIAGLLVQLCC